MAAARYTPTTTKGKKKDTEMNPVRSKVHIISCMQVKPPRPVQGIAAKAPPPLPSLDPVSVNDHVPTPAAAKVVLTKAAVKYYADTDTHSTTTESPRRNAVKTKKKPKPLKRLCRCGTYSVVGNTKKTCRNNRCPCYRYGNTCTNCPCLSCHNPHKTDFLDSDDEDELENLAPPSLLNPQSERPAPTKAKEAKPTATNKVNVEKTGVSAQALDGPQGGITLVPINNLEQSQHPLVLIQNEHGQYQSFNMFQGSVPIDPATVGFLRVQMQNINSNSEIPQYAYVIPPPPVVA